MGDGRPTCNRVLTSSGSVGMGIPMGSPMGIPVRMGWVWGLKCHPHGSPDVECGRRQTDRETDRRQITLLALERFRPPTSIELSYDRLTLIGRREPAFFVCRWQSQSRRADDPVLRRDWSEAPDTREYWTLSTPFPLSSSRLAMIRKRKRKVLPGPPPLDRCL